jgi:RimJ/RimL family protein N-acetyltransferase
MGRAVSLTQPEVVERFARRDVALHIYELGDLDPFFWPKTRWWGLAGEQDELSALALLYDGAGESSTFVALGRDDGGAVGELAALICDELPDRVYGHLSPGVVDRLAGRFPAVRHHGRHLKMVLADRAALDGVALDEVVRLGEADRPELEALYRRAYPDNCFDPRMLETGQYFGMRADGDGLICVAGVHVCSPRYRVAALGNVTTHPGYRRRGLARRATARLCRSLIADGIDAIGLNVLADNAAAVACYAQLGFVRAAEYDEYALAADGSGAAVTAGPPRE